MRWQLLERRQVTHHFEPERKLEPNNITNLNLYLSFCNYHALRQYLVIVFYLVRRKIKLEVAMYVLAESFFSNGAKAFLSHSEKQKQKCQRVILGTNRCESGGRILIEWLSLSLIPKIRKLLRFVLPCVCRWDQQLVIPAVSCGRSTNKSRQTYNDVKNTQRANQLPSKEERRLTMTSNLIYHESQSDIAMEYTRDLSLKFFLTLPRSEASPKVKKT